MAVILNRHRFLKIMVSVFAVLLLPAIGIHDAMAHQEKPAVAYKVPVLIEPFDYYGVTLRPCRWQQQYQMARAYSATGDVALRDKAVRLVTEYEKTVPDNGDPRLINPYSKSMFPTIKRDGSTSTYTYEKLVGGLLDLDRYCGYEEARPLLDRIVDWGIEHLDRPQISLPNRGPGRPIEWYTVAENFYRAYHWLGNEKYLNFAKLWHYDTYWNKFLVSTAPDDVTDFHAYSHVNTLSSCAMAYAISGDKKYLRIIKNAYDWLQSTQCYATGGYGPNEGIVASDGAFGRSLEITRATAETPCGSWAGFKLSKYLMQFTGEAHYGDWIEKLLYNGVGAALPITTGGRTFYYADYNIKSGQKTYYHHPYPCCAGTYLQDVVEYHDLIYFKDNSSLYVNLYFPSELTWQRGEDLIKIVQETRYPEDETSLLRLELSDSLEFPIKFRIPKWSRGISFKVNGELQGVAAKPGDWAAIKRTWKTADEIEIRIPLVFRTLAVDKQHPGRIAVMRGPLVFAQKVVGDWIPELPPSEELDKWLVPSENPGEFRIANVPEGIQSGVFKPFYCYVEKESYRMSFDAK